jgi:hypothetical protein
MVMTFNGKPHTTCAALIETTDGFGSRWWCTNRDAELKLCELSCGSCSVADGVGKEFCGAAAATTVSTTAAVVAATITTTTTATPTITTPPITTLTATTTTTTTASTAAAHTNRTTPFPATTIIADTVATATATETPKPQRPSNVVSLTSTQKLMLLNKHNRLRASVTVPCTVSNAFYLSLGQCCSVQISSARDTHFLWHGNSGTNPPTSSHLFHISKHAC